MIPTAKPIRRTTRDTLLRSCASLAIAAAALAPQQAAAQAFNGTAGASSGVSAPSLTTNTIVVTDYQATINWTASSNDFLPIGATQNFTSSNTIQFYTVINRVTPADSSTPIQLNGNVISTLQGTANRGGNIWFYSPSGIMVGSSATFDVGGLLLTSLTPTLDSSGVYFDGGEIVGNTFDASFSKNTGDGGPIQILAGAQITANQNGSYVALVAPRIEQGGNVQVNGSAAYVAAENLTMTMDQGLFDIAVDFLGGGTDDLEGVVHTGTTGGEASTGAVDNHRIYMVAVPKNQALTMLLSGTVGFDPAISAEVENGAIVLSSGWNVMEADGSLDMVRASSGHASISIGSGTYSSDLTAMAAGNIFAIADEDNLGFTGDVSLESDEADGEGRVHVGAINGGDVSVGGDLTIASNYATTLNESVLYANSGGSVTVAGDTTVTAQREFGGDFDPIAAINADAGSIVLTGDVLLTANATSPSFSEAPGDAAGGDINVLASNGGTVTVGSLTAHADAFGQADFFGSGFSGNGTGGDINIVAASSGGITVNGALFATADGYGGTLLDGTTLGGYGQGGQIRVAADGGSVAITGNAALSANGTGGEYAGEGIPSESVSGDGYGGWARFETTSSQDSTISIGGGVVVNANGFGGDGQTGGGGYGGSSGMTAFAGGINITGAVTLNANGIGGDSVIGFGGDGGYAEGGTAYIEARASSVAEQFFAGTIITGDVFMDVLALGGDGGDGNGDNIAAGSGGGAQGGLYTGEEGSGGAFALADAAGAVLQLGNLTMAAAGLGGIGGTGGMGQVGGTGGDAYGGFVQAGSFNPSGTTDLTGSAEFGDVSMDASAFGGAGGVGDEGNGGAADGDGGAAYGGGNTECGELGETCGGAVINAKGSVTTGTVSMAAIGWGGDGGNGGNAGPATGGYTQIQSFAGSSLETTGSVLLQSSAYGGAAPSGVGGHTIAGTAVAVVEAGATLTVDGSLNVWADAFGGIGASGAGGEGGTAVVQVSGGDLTVAGDLTASASGMGGDGSQSNGALAIGGTASITAEAGGAIDATQSIQALALATAGDGIFQEAFYNAGDATGGTASITADGASILAGQGIVLSTLATAGAAAGAEATGGDAIGGDNILTAVNGGSVDAGGFVNLNAAAFGGDAVWQGGNAQAGSSTIVIAGGDLSAASIGNYANAWGGYGYFAGDGHGGLASLNIGELGGSIDVAGEAGVEAMGFGGGSGDVEGTGGYGGSGLGGTAAIDIQAAGIADFGSVYADASGFGGDGGDGVTGGLGGDGTAGWATVNVDGTLTATGDVGTYAAGYGGAGGAGSSTGGQGGAGYGGTTDVTINGTVTAASVTSWTRGYGGAGGTGATAGDGGYAEGGSSGLSLYGALTGAVLVNATAFGGAGANGGEGQGGQAIADLYGALTTTEGLQVTAQGFGGEGLSGAGGDGTGGSSDLYAGGTVDVGWAFMGNGGFGGNGVTAGGAGYGGDGYAVIGGAMTVDTAFDMQVWATGGTASVGSGGLAQGGYAQLDGGELGGLTAADVTVTAAATGGDGGDAETGGDGGTAYAGTALIDTGLATFNVSGTMQALADATGGAGGDGTTGVGGNGGDAWAGGDSAFINIYGTAIVGTARSSAQATGGDGGTGTTDGVGGDATGGHASVDVFDDGSLTSVTLIEILSSAAGGNGSEGGYATGGTSGFGIYGTGIATLNAVNMDSSATGGNGTTGNGGTGDAGLAVMLIDGIVTTTGLLRIASTGTGGDGVNGGNGWGGESSLLINGSLTSGATDIVADGFGGEGTTGYGGDGLAWLAMVENSGTWTSSGEVFVSADGEGGEGASAGGSGVGGDAAVRLFEGTTDLTGSVTVSARGAGGDSTNGTGGGGYGGYARLSSYLGATATVNNLTVDSGGDGGDGVNGGEGYAQPSVEGWGGSVIQALDEGSSLILTGQTNALSNGTGGAATGSEGVGGNGSGGYASLAAHGVAVTVGDALIEATGTGGVGNGGDGTGSGGHVRLGSFGGSLTGGAIVLDASGSTDGGDAGVFAESGGDLDVASLNATSNGGLTGGEIYVGVGPDATADLGVAALTVAGDSGTGNVTIEAGTSSASFVGDVLFADSLTVNSSGTIDVIGHNGAGVNVANAFNATAVGDVTLDDVTANTVDVSTFGLANVVGIISASEITLASGQINIGEDGSVGENGVTQVVNLVAVTDSPVIIGSGGEPSEGSYVFEDGEIVTNTINISAQSASGGIAPDILVYAVEIDGSLAEDGGVANISLTTGGNVAINGPVEFFEAAATDTFAIIAGGNVTTIADFATPGSLSIDAGSLIDAGNLTSGGSMTLNALASIDAGNLNAGGGIAAQAGTTLTVGNVTSGSVAPPPPPPPSEGFTTAAIVASGENIALTTGGNMTTGAISSGEGIAIISGGTLTTGALDAVAAITANSVGDMLLESANAGQALALTSGANLASGDLAGQTVDVIAAGSLSVGNVDAGGTATFVAGGLAGFLGLVAAPTITVTSGGLFIDDGAGLGVSGLTSLITFNAVSDGPVIIGGEDSAESGYQLTAEGDISADAVVVNAVAGNDVILRDLEIEGSATAGGGVGSVTLNTGGSVIVEGAVDYINAGTTDTLAINSGEVIEVITDGGSISMTDSAGNLAGTLELTAHDIWVADQTVIDQLEADPNFAGLETALATNNGPVNPDGYIQAGGVTATMLGSSLLVQNSGTSEAPAGLTVGDGGLTVVNLGSDPATVIVYGQQMNSDGTIVGGDAFVEDVSFSGSGGFTPTSSINGCDVGGSCASEGPETPGTGAESILGPIGLISSTSGDGAPEDSEEEEEEEEGDDKSGTDPSVNLINTAPLQLDTTIDEPITSGSDSPGGQI